MDMAEPGCPVSRRQPRPKQGWLYADIECVLKNHAQPDDPSRGGLPTSAAVAWLDRWRKEHRPPIYRPAAGAQPPTAQRIPRRIFQTVSADAAAAAASSPLIRSWLTLNPDYDYHLFEEADCMSFVDAVGTAAQRQVYHGLATGAGRSDFFRVLVLLHLGGVSVPASLVALPSTHECARRPCLVDARSPAAGLRRHGRGNPSPIKQHWYGHGGGGPHAAHSH